jgi:SSS family solute:Na+ symporter
VSSLTSARPDRELEGLVYSLTPRPKEDGVPLYKQPGPLALVVLLLTVVLNGIFW